MKTHHRAVGRPPSIDIIPSRLRQLRKNKGWTLEYLAKCVSESQNLKKIPDPDSLKNKAYRWERFGKLSLQTATILADVLGVTLAVLRGAEPEAQPSRTDEILIRIREQLAIGNETLAQLLDKDEEIFIAEKDLAERLGVDLEYAQLSQDIKEFQRLSDLLGCSISELQQPVGIHGHWMLVCNGPGLPNAPAIVHGIAELRHLVDSYAKECLDSLESDAKVTMTQDSVWTRVAFSHPRIPELFRSLSFVRCQASATGLLWTKPTWVDDHFIQSLPKRLSEYANYVTGFDQQELGPRNLANLKLAIYELAIHQESEPQSESTPAAFTALTSGCLNEQMVCLPNFVRDGSSHDAVTRWLCADLLEAIQPLMDGWPMKYWQFNAHEHTIRVNLDVPGRSLLAMKQDRIDEINRPKLDIKLVESTGDKPRHVPWRRKSIENALARIQKDLQHKLSEPDRAIDASAPLA